MKNPRTVKDLPEDVEASNIHISPFFQNWKLATGSCQLQPAKPGRDTDCHRHSSVMFQLAVEVAVNAVAIQWPSEILHSFTTYILFGFVRSDTFPVSTEKRKHQAFKKYYKVSEEMERKSKRIQQFKVDTVKGLIHAKLLNDVNGQLDTFQRGFG
jgi:hypothetical protein